MNSMKHKRQTAVHCTRLVRRCICATVRRKRKQYPKRYIFDTELQEDAERVMADLGYGCCDYWLSFVQVTPNVKAVYPPCPDARAFRRFVRATGAWRIHCC